MHLNEQLDLEAQMAKMRYEKASQGWISGLAALDHTVAYENNIILIKKHSYLSDIYITNLEEGEELYFDNNENDVFVNSSFQNVAHVLVVSKTANNISAKWISLAVFRRSVTQFKMEGNHGNPIFYANWEESEKYNYETFSEEIIRDIFPLELRDFKNHYVSIYPATKHTNDVFKEVYKCKTNLEIWEKLKGKCVKVVKTTSVETYDPFIYGGMGGMRTVRVPAFVFVDKDINKEIKNEKHYEPYYFFGNYRIIVDEKTNKWGIKNLKTGKVVVPCVYDHISYQSYDNPQYVKKKTTLVKFETNGYEAFCKANELK